MKQPRQGRSRDSATRAVALLQASQASWNRRQVCFSCHHQFQPAIAFAVARAHGIPVDETLAATNRARHFRFDDLDDALQYANALEPALSNGYRMIAAHAAGISPALSTAIEARFLIERQRSAGDWAGLNQRPPSSSSDFAKTAIGMRAVQLFHHPADKAPADRAIARAAQWLLSHEAPDTEGRVYQLIGLQWAGADRRTRERLAHGLEQMQRADGGWGSIPGRDSEAYSTGEVLFALKEAGGISVSAPAWQRGLAYLLRTQAADGSWQREMDVRRAVFGRQTRRPRRRRGTRSLHPHQPQKIVREYVRRAGSTSADRQRGVHILRHTFCSHLAMRGAPARAIQELPGHKDLSTTQRYMHLSPAAIEGAIRLLEATGSAPRRGDIVETGRG